MSPPVLRSIASGLAALGTPLVCRSYPASSKTPFADDRRNLYMDYRRVERDLKKSIEKVKQQYGSEAHRR